MAVKVAYSLAVLKRNAESKLSMLKAQPPFLTIKMAIL